MADAQITIAGKSYDLDDFTLGELEEFEEALGAPMADVNLSSAKAAIHLAYMVMRRDNPALTLDEVRGMKVSAFDEDQEEAPPTKAKAAKAKPKEAAAA